MRCLLLCRYSRLGASSRIRHLQYLPHLTASRIDVATHALLDDAYLNRIYSGASPPWVDLLSRYKDRLGLILQARRFDLVWIEKELFPMMPAWAESLLYRTGIPYVVDYDDPTFHFYDQHPSPLVRSLLGRKIDRVMRNAACVVVGNAYLGERARRAGARQIEEIPSVVDLALYPPYDPPENKQFTIGWIGTPATVRLFEPILGALRSLHQTHPFRLVVIGAPTDAFKGLDAVARPWSEASEAEELRQLDVGIMPLPDGPWERGKCGYKLIQYFASGKPVVASPIGINTEIVTHGENGFLAARSEDWITALRTLHENPVLRNRMGMAGRKRVEERYALQVTAPRMAALLSQCARRPRTR